MVPNNFNKEKFNTVGLIENNMVYAYKKRDNRPFKVPSDWTIHIAYNVGMFSGSVAAETWVEEFSEGD